MPMPMEYQRAGEEFERFLAAARDKLGLATRNQTYTVVQAVLQTFRRRLDVKQAIAFAGVLPPVVRAIFVVDWNLDEPVIPFCDRKSLTREVRALRQDHNFAPDSAIADVAAALWQVADAKALRACLDALPTDAAQYWADDS
jgi:uncharacterized protein (DUF2267 family)